MHCGMSRVTTLAEGQNVEDDAHQEEEGGQKGVAELRLLNQIYRLAGPAWTHALLRPRGAFFSPLVCSFGAPIRQHGCYRAQRRPDRLKAGR